MSLVGNRFKLMVVSPTKSVGLIRLHNLLKMYQHWDISNVYTFYRKQEKKQMIQSHICFAIFNIENDVT